MDAGPAPAASTSLRPPRGGFGPPPRSRATASRPPARPLLCTAAIAAAGLLVPLLVGFPLRGGASGGPAPVFLAGRQAPPSGRLAALTRRQAEREAEQIASGLRRLVDTEEEELQPKDSLDPAAEAAEAAGTEPWPTVLRAIKDFYNETILPNEITRAAKEFYDYEKGELTRALKSLDESATARSLDESAVARLRHRGSALVRLLGKNQAASGLRDALYEQSAVLASFADKARCLASSPADFVSGLSEVFRSVEDVEEAARLAAEKAQSPLSVEGEAGDLATGSASRAAAPTEEEHPHAPYGLVVHDSAARRSATGDWVVPIQAWIYRRNEARHRIRMALCRKLLVEMYHGITDIDEEAKKRYEERGRLIFRTLAFRGGEKNSVLEVRFDGAEAWQPLPPTGGDGRVKTELPLKAELVERAARRGEGPGGRPSLGFQVRIAEKKAGGHNVTIRATALLTEPEGVLVVSDIDDTVKVTEVFLGKDMVVRNTFLEEFRAVSGMSPLYRSWARDFGASFAFVSNSPPEFQEILRDFLGDSGFPNAPIHLRPLAGTKEERKLFKQNKIEELLAQFPRRKVILVGDSGERDPVMSAELLRKYPKQVVKALIRQVHPDLAVDPAVFEGLPQERWQVFSDPSEASLPDELRDQSVPSFLRWKGWGDEEQQLQSQDLEEHLEAREPA